MGHVCRIYILVFACLVFSRLVFSPLVFWTAYLEALLFFQFEVTCSLQSGTLANLVKNW